jgi:hypothetical protein
MFSIGNFIALFVILIVLVYLYKKFQEKQYQEKDLQDYMIIKNFLVNDSTSLTKTLGNTLGNTLGDTINTTLTNTTGKTQKPILWIYIPYEYNARNWLSFGSRSSHELNQPYLYLTVRTIIDQCQDSFHICMIDDDAFPLLIPNWSIHINKTAQPVQYKIRMLALANILYIYGGMLLPISFLCLQDLSSLYEEGVKGGRMFVCESENKNSTSTHYKFYPNLQMMGTTRKNETMLDLIHHIEMVISRDYTSESQFLGNFSTWCEKHIEAGDIHSVDGRLVGTKGTNELPITVNDLLGDYYIQLYPQAYGIWIPAMDILKRRHYEWFSRLSTEQVLHANTILSKYFKLALHNELPRGVIEPLENRPTWVSFWKTPLVSLYGLKPNFLGDNLLSSKFPDY